MTISELVAQACRPTPGRATIMLCLEGPMVDAERVRRAIEVALALNVRDAREWTIAGPSVFVDDAAEQRAAA